MVGQYLKNDKIKEMTRRSSAEGAIVARHTLNQHYDNNQHVATPNKMTKAEHYTAPAMTTNKHVSNKPKADTSTTDTKYNK